MLYFCLIILSLNACAWYFYHRTRAVPAVPPPIENEPPPDPVPEYVTKEFFKETLERLHTLLSKNLREMHEYNKESFTIVMTVLEKTLQPQPINKTNSKNHVIGFQYQGTNKKKSKAG